jgi:hypothetical protein
MGCRRAGPFASSPCSRRARPLPTASQAAQVYLSSAGGATIGGLTFRDGDIARYDTETGLAMLFFNEDNFSANENIDAFHILPNGNILLSTDGV